MLAGFTMNSVRYHGAVIAVVILPPLLLILAAHSPIRQLLAKVGTGVDL